MVRHRRTANGVPPNLEGEAKRGKVAGRGGAPFQNVYSSCNNASPCHKHEVCSTRAQHCSCGSFTGITLGTPKPSIRRKLTAPARRGEVDPIAFPLQRRSHASTISHDYLPIPSVCLTPIVEESHVSFITTRAARQKPQVAKHRPHGRPGADKNHTPASGGEADQQQQQRKQQGGGTAHPRKTAPHHLPLPALPALPCLGPNSPCCPFAAAGARTARRARGTSARPSRPPGPAPCTRRTRARDASRRSCARTPCSGICFRVGLRLSYTNAYVCLCCVGAARGWLGWLGICR